MVMAEGITLEDTPTWVVAVVTAFIVLICLFVQGIFELVGKYLKKPEQGPLFQAVQKIKEELMLLGFISLMLTVFQDRISKICIPDNMATIMLPCKKSDTVTTTTTHFQTIFSSFDPHTAGRHLLAETATNDAASAYCIAKGKLPLLSQTALHHLHILIFFLAVAHVTFSGFTVFVGSLRIRQWEKWEADARKFGQEEVLKIIKKVYHVDEHDSIRNCSPDIGKMFAFLGCWIHSFFKQFYGSITISEYITMREGYIMCYFGKNGLDNFELQKCIMQALEAADFKKIVGISWYLWVLVVLLLLLNLRGWNAYFWISFIPLILLLVVGTKLEHVKKHLAREVAEKHEPTEGESESRSKFHHFWFHRPQIIFLLIHILLFQNSFEFAFFFWIWVQYGFDSCIMGKLGYIIPRLVIGVLVQFICSYSTFPLYAIVVTPMGKPFEKEVNDIQKKEKGLVTGLKRMTTYSKKEISYLAKSVKNYSKKEISDLAKNVKNTQEEISEFGKRMKRSFSRSRSGTREEDQVSPSSSAQVEGLDEKRTMTTFPRFREENRKDHISPYSAQLETVVEQDNTTTEEEIMSESV